LRFFEVICGWIVDRGRGNRPATITKLMSAHAWRAVESPSLLELRGLGKDLWENVDVEAYIKRERDSWA